MIYRLNVCKRKSLILCAISWIELAILLNWFHWEADAYEDKVHADRFFPSDPRCPCRPARLSSASLPQASGRTWQDLSRWLRPTKPGRAAICALWFHTVLQWCDAIHVRRVSTMQGYDGAKKFRRTDSGEPQPAHEIIPTSVRYNLGLGVTKHLPWDVNTYWFPCRERMEKINNLTPGSDR
jgi:hypothetical protein